METLKNFLPFSKKGSTQSKESNNHAVIYTRVSTKEQAENNLSLDTQKKYCQHFAEKQGLTVRSYFGGTYESAQTDERREFKNMLAFVRKNNVSHIVVYSIDRFSRSGAGAIGIIAELSKKGILVRSVTQPTDPKTSMGSFYQNIQLVFSQYDNEQRRSKCITGMKERLSRGYWVGKAPLGYCHIHDANNKPVVVISEQGKLLQKSFLWKVHERLTNTEITKRLKALGLNVSKQRLTEVFRNPFYCGIITHGLLNEPVMGSHEPLVSQELFLKANQIVKKVPHDYKHQVVNDDLPLKRFVKCKQCGVPFTGYFVKNKDKHYYKCNNPHCKSNTSKDKLHEKFKELLSGFKIDEKLIEPLKIQLKYVFEHFCKVDISEYAVLRKRFCEIEQRIEKLKERFAIGELDKALYEQFIEKFNEEKESVNRTINSLNGNNDLSSFITYAEEVCRNLIMLWDQGNYEQKQRLQYLLFPEGLLYSKEGNSFTLSTSNPLLADKIMDTVS